jgi:hypothetical protein
VNLATPPWLWQPEVQLVCASQEPLMHTRSVAVSLPVPSVHLHAAGLQSSALLHAPPWPTPVHGGPLVVLVLELEHAPRAVTTTNASALT